VFPFPASSRPYIPSPGVPTRTISPAAPVRPAGAARRARGRQDHIGEVIGMASCRSGSARYRSGRSPDWLKMKDPGSTRCEARAEEDWGNMARTRPAGQARGRAAEHVLLRTSVGALTIGLLLCLTQSSVNAQARQCPAGHMFCFGKCVDTSSDQANCGGCRVLCRDGQVCRDRICVTPSPLPPARATPPPQSR
jgi:Stigma-specific protein, Stig1